MSELLKRLFTSTVLIIILYKAFSNEFVLFFLFILTCFIVLIEFYHLIKKIYINEINKILILFFISIFYLIFCFTQLFFFITGDYDKMLLFIYLLSICIATDLGGYIFGKLFKGKKLTNISPNKTYSGLIGSYVISYLVFIYFYFEFKYPLSYIILTFFVSSISQLGDLFISCLKRKANVKDTGRLLPGHGGMLDRIDGIIIAIPVSINLLFLF